jgi:hypothetical protein
VSNFDILVFICTVAAVSGVTPTLISIFTSLLASTLGRGHNNTKLWTNSLPFFTGFIGTITVIGTSFWVLLTRIDATAALYLCLGVAALAVAAAIIEIKDYFWYGRGISHKPHKRLHSALHKHTSKKFGVVSAFSLGVIAVAATASNIGLVAITTASLLYVTNLAPNVGWFVLFSMCLLVGTFATLITVVGGTKISAVLQWKEEGKAVMRLGSGLALAASAWLILLIISHTLTVGL